MTEIAATIWDRTTWDKKKRGSGQKTLTLPLQQSKQASQNHEKDIA